MFKCLSQKPSVQFALFTMTLIAGEVMGFAVSFLADIWVVFTCVCGTVLFAIWGWGKFRLTYVALFLLGGVLAAHTEAQLRGILDANAGMYGPRPVLHLPVEESASVPVRVKNGGWRTEFPSHVGVLPLKVVLPLGNQDVPVPKRGEVWDVVGQIAFQKDRMRRFERRTLWAMKQKGGVRVAVAKRGLSWPAIGDELARRAGAGLDWTLELAALNRAILLGRRTELSAERRQIFVDAGTIHLFAISGLHVMVVAWILRTLLQRLELAPGLQGLVCTPLIVAYVVLTGSRPSAVRAALMASIWLMGPVFGRQPDSLMAWSVTAFIVYVLSPELLFDLGCSLSFIVMFGIVLWCKWTRQFAPLFGLERIPKLRSFVGGLGVSLAAWIAGVPVAASAFGRFTPGGLLANAVVILCAEYMVKIGASALVVSFVCMPLAAVLNNMAAVFTWMMSFVSSCVAALPFSTFEVVPWGLCKSACWYAAWLVFFRFVGMFLPQRGLVSKKWW